MGVWVREECVDYSLDALPDAACEDIPDDDVDYCPASPTDEDSFLYTDDVDAISLPERCIPETSNPPTSITARTDLTQESPRIHDARLGFEARVLRETTRSLPVLGGVLDLHYDRGAFIDFDFPYAAEDLTQSELERNEDGAFQLVSMQGVQVRLNAPALVDFLSGSSSAGVLTAVWLSHSLHRWAEAYPALTEAITRSFEIPITGFFLLPSTNPKYAGNLQLCVGLDLSQLPFIGDDSQKPAKSSSKHFYIPLVWGSSLLGVDLDEFPGKLLNPHFDWGTGLDADLQGKIWQALQNTDEGEGNPAPMDALTESLPELDDIDADLHLNGLTADLATDDIQCRIQYGELQINYHPWEIESWQARGDFTIELTRLDDAQNPVLLVATLEASQFSNAGISGFLTLDAHPQNQGNALFPRSEAEVHGAGIDLSELSYADFGNTLRDVIENLVLEYTAGLGEKTLTRGQATLARDAETGTSRLRLTGNAQVRDLAADARAPDIALNYDLDVDPHESSGVLSIQNVSIPILPGLTIQAALNPSPLQIQGKKAVMKAQFTIVSDDGTVAGRTALSEMNITADLETGMIHIDDLDLAIPHPLEIDVGYTGRTILVDAARVTGSLHFDTATHRITGPLRISATHPHTSKTGSEKSPSLIFTDGLKTRTEFAGVIRPASQDPTAHRARGTGNLMVNLDDFDLVLSLLEPVKDGYKIVFTGESHSEPVPAGDPVSDSVCTFEPAGITAPLADLQPMGKPQIYDISTSDLAYAEAGLSDEMADLLRRLLPRMEAGHFEMQKIRLVANEQGQVQFGPLVFSVPPHLTMTVSFDVGKQDPQSGASDPDAVGRITDFRIRFSEPLTGVFDLAGFHFDPERGQFLIDAASTEGQDPESFIETVSLNKKIFKMLGLSDLDLMKEGINPKHLSNRADMFLRLYLLFLRKRHETLVTRAGRTEDSMRLIDMSQAQFVGTGLRVQNGTRFPFKGMQFGIGTDERGRAIPNSGPNEFSFRINLGRQTVDLQCRHIGNLNITLGDGQSFVLDDGQSVSASAIFEHGRVDNVHVDLNGGMNMTATGVRFDRARAVLEGQAAVLDGMAEASAEMRSYFDLKVNTVSLSETSEDDGDHIRLSADFDTRVVRSGSRFSVDTQTHADKTAQFVIQDSDVHGNAEVHLVRKTTTPSMNVLPMLRPSRPQTQLYLDQADLSIHSERIHFASVDFSPGIHFTDSVSKDATLTLRRGRVNELVIQGLHHWVLAEPSPDLPVLAGGLLSGVNPHVKFDSLVIGGSSDTNTPGYGFARYHLSAQGMDVETDPTRPLVMQFHGSSHMGDDAASAESGQLSARYEFTDDVILERAHVNFEEGKVRLTRASVRDWNSDIQVSWASLPPIPGLPETLNTPLMNAEGHLRVDRAVLDDQHHVHFYGTDFRMQDPYHFIKIDGDWQITPEGLALEGASGRIAVSGTDSESRVVMHFKPDDSIIHQ